VPAVNSRADYRLDVQAPEPLRKLLTEYLDLARFQNAPAAEAIDATELERLLRAAPSQARGLLETEGYFNAEVSVARAGSDEAGVPRVRIVVEPGVRATIAELRIDATGDLQTAAAAGDATALRTLESLRSQWPLRAGDAFRQAAWADAKNATLARLRAGGYAAATWSDTHAHVDAPSNRVGLDVALDSGPLYRLGELRIEGLSRYDEDAVRRLTNFTPGDAYSEKLLLDFQERLQKVGLFEGASVELDADAKNAAAAPVLVRVKELPLQQATVGIGYSANTGPRLSVEHTQRRVFGSRWIAKNKFQLGPDQQTWEGDLTSHPLEGLYRNLVSGSATRLRAADQLQLSWNARLGRTKDAPRIERLYFGELTHARVDSATLTSQADAVSYNYHWIYRDIDSVLLPTRGLTASAQAALGWSQGSRSADAEPLVESKGPFARIYTRLTWYEPLGATWYGTARVEAGQVFTRNVVGVPDTLLFRAGGDDSVRGYGYRTLGPTVDGVTTSGRNLLTGSIEIARPISPKYPAYWWAAFIDAGDAADRWADVKPAFGYGLGLRWRSPVGPLRVDVAYGQEVRQVRLHLSVGIAF
jgi:translocation and assembly module TamA